MISKGSTVVLRTKEAIYSTCQIVTTSSENITITYLAGMKKDKRTKRYYEDRRVETISRRNILSLSERL